jgi:hypothetical protein
MNVNRNIVAAALLAAAAGPALAQYGFTADGNGTHIKIWWTDQRGNRIGDPVYDGVLQSGESVTRNTRSPDVYDHSLQELASANAAINDVIAGNGLPLETSGLPPTDAPTLFDRDPAGGLSNIFYVINASQWIAGGGHSHVGQVIGGFAPNGTNPALPGITVAYSPIPNLPLEQALRVDPVTGQVLFMAAQPFGPEQGTLTVSSTMHLNGRPCPVDVNGDGQVNVADYLAFLQLYAAGDPAADMNADGIVNILDYLAFLQRYSLGCP